MKNIVLRGGGVVAGMIVSEVIAQSVSKYIPIDVANKDDIIQTLIGAGAIGFGMSKGDGIVGEVATFFGLGAVISAMLGFLKLKIPYLAQAGEEDEFEEIFVDEFGNEVAFAGEEPEIYFDTETQEYIAMAGSDEVMEMVPLDNDIIIEDPEDMAVQAIF